MKWYDFAENAAGIISVYKDQELFNDVDIKEMIFSRNGPTLTISLDLRQYPINPPQKWKKDDLNTVSLELCFIEVSDVLSLNWKTSNPSRVLIERNEVLNVHLEGVISFKSRFMTINTISAYLKNR